MTRYDPTCHHRRSIRLKKYDYTQPGAYFITICTHERAHLFGEVVDGHMRLNNAGRIAEQCWRDIPAHFPHVELDAFVIMPNHVHGVLWIVDNVGARHAVPPPPTDHVEQFGKPLPGSIPTIVRAFKSAVTQRINAWRNTPGAPVWQRNYYEHIIRDEYILNTIRQYIIENPLRWHLDRYNPDRIGNDPIVRKIWDMIRERLKTNRGEAGGPP
ncbi:MAG: transposase [Thermodesulforhabdaceae bacterium]